MIALLDHIEQGGWLGRDHHPPAPPGAGSHGYDIFKHKRNNCEKVVLKA